MNITIGEKVIPIIQITNMNDFWGGVIIGIFLLFAFWFMYKYVIFWRD